MAHHQPPRQGGNTFRRQTVLEMANYYHTGEAKEMGRAFNTKQDPDKFYK